MYKRIIDLISQKDSFFLWGPRQVGKSSLLKASFPNSTYIDLLKSDVFIKYQTHPELLRKELLARKERGHIIIDEVQKLPILLDEIHSLIEEHKLKFALCGSSARKLKRGAANLLGGRALRRELYGLAWKELGSHFDLKKILNRGTLPRHYDSENYKDFLSSYVADYLREEIFSEGLVQNLRPFSEFLSLASLSDTDILSYTSFSSDVGVSSATVKSYFDILEETLIGTRLPAYRKRPKRRIQTTPKFYFFDVGVVNSLARRGQIEEGTELFGKAFENWFFHELQCYKAYVQRDLPLHFWKLSNSIEVDFLLGDMEVAIEVKGTRRLRPEHFKGLKEIKSDYPVKARYMVSLDPNFKIEDKIQCLYFEDFLERLWSGKVI